MATITSLGFTIFARERVSRVFRSIGDNAEEMAGRARRAARTVGEQFQALDDTMTKAGAAAGVALGAAMVKSVDASAATAKLGAQIGATAQQSKRFGEIAGRLYSQAYGESIEDVHGAIGAVVTSIDGMRNASDSAVEGMARKALTLAKVFEIDTARSIQVVGQIVKTGLVKDATEGMDLLTVALQRVPAAVRDDLLDALDEYGPFMEQIGIKGARAFEILIQAADKGAFGLDKAGDAFKEITLKIASSAPAVDEALRSIGLSQERVQDAFARGGAEGQRAFQQIVDGLLKIPDPGKRAETAITLFGTPIEDLNTKDIPRFLESLVGTQSELRNTAGAADRAGAAVQDAAATKLESFKRSVEQNLSKVIAEDVIPKLEKLSSTAKGVGLTPSGAANAILTLGAVAAGYKTIAFAAKIATFQVGRFSIAKGVAGAATTLSNVAAGFRNVNLAMAANATTATRLGAALRSQIMLWRQQAAAANVSTARIILNAAAQKIAAAATRTWAIAQAIFNAVMRANPLVLIVTVIMLVIGAVVLAYKRFESFRTLVDAVWAGIKTALAAAWNFIKPIFLQIASVLVNVVGTALKWYAAYVKLVFTAVWTIISTVWNTAIKPIFNAIANVLRVILPRAFTFFQNIAKIVWIAIQIYIKIAWTLIKGYFNLIKFYVTKILAPAFTWLWKNIIVPVWNGIRWAIGKAWGIIKVIFAAIRAVITGVLAPVFRWLWNNVIKPVWNGIREHISNVWNKGIKPAFDKIKSGVRAVRDAFSTASDGIKKIWNRVKGYAKTPVNFIIGTVYNKGIVGLVNKVAKFAGIDTRLDPIKLLARGGTLDNPARVAPMKTRGAMAIVGEGRSLYPEYVIPTDPRFRDRALALWAQAGQDLAGRSAPGKRMGGEGLMFERGGIIGKFLGGLKSFAFDKPAEMFKSTVDKLIGQIPGSGTFRDVVAGVPKKLAGSLVQWFKDKVGFGGGKGVSKALAFAKAQAGKPYIWGGVGPRGYDCSGLWSAIVNVIKGRNPYSRRFTTFSFTGGMHGPEGFIRNLHSAVRVGVTNAGVGHMAGTLGRTPVESRGSRGVVVGAGARGAEDSLFTMRYGLKADTGAATLAPGWNPVYNGTGRPEYLETPRRGGGDTHVHVHVENHGVIGSRIELQDWLARNLDDLRRQGRLPIGT